MKQVDKVWKEVAPDLASLEVTPAEKIVLLARWETFLQNPTAPLAAGQFKTCLRTLLNKRKALHERHKRRRTSSITTATTHR